MPIEDALNTPTVPAEADPQAVQAAAEATQQMEQAQRVEEKEQKVSDLRKRLDEKYQGRLEDNADLPPAKPAAEQNSGETPPEGAAEGSKDKAGDSLPAELLDRAKSLGLPETVIQSFGTNAKALESVMAHMQEQKPAKPVVPPETKPVEELPQEWKLPDEAKDWDPKLREAFEAQAKHFNSKLQTLAVAAQQQSLVQERSFVSAKCESDTKYAAHLKDAGTRESVRVTMHALQAAALQNGQKPLGVDQLYAKAVAATLADKISDIENGRIKSELSKRRPGATLPPISKSPAESLMTRTTQEIKDRIDAKYAAKLNQY